MRPLYLSFIQLLFCTKVLAWPPRCYPWFGQPDPAHCEALILGGTDFPGHNDGRGIDRIDTNSHAFTLIGASRESETDEQWQNWVWIPKILARDEYPNCNIALLPFDADEWRLSRDTSTWLSIARVGLQINHHCVQGQGMGGFEFAGDQRALSMIVYTPGSDFDINTAQNLKSGKPVTFRRWRDDGSSDDEDERNPPRKRKKIGGGESTAWNHVPIHPGIRGFGNNWVLNYGSLTKIDPLERAAEGLSRFYGSIIETATASLANATVESSNMVFASKGLHLRFSSSESIEWLWVVRFVEAMASSLMRGFTMLYDKSIAENLVWEVPTVLITLSVA